MSRAIRPPLNVKPDTTKPEKSSGISKASMHDNRDTSINIYLYFEHIKVRANGTLRLNPVFSLRSRPQRFIAANAALAYVLVLTFSACWLLGESIIALSGIALLAIHILFVSLIAYRRADELDSAIQKSAASEAAIIDARLEKQTLLKEADQDAKKTLQTIISLTNFTYRRIRKDKAQPLEAIQGLQGRLATLACVQRSLGVENNASAISADVLFRDIVAQETIDEEYITNLSIGTNNMMLDVSLAAEVSLIFNEMYSKAVRNCYLRHTCDISISLQNTNAVATLSMEARGKIGDLVEKMNYDELSGEIIMMLCEQIDAKFEFLEDEQAAKWQLMFQPGVFAK